MKRDGGKCMYIIFKYYVAHQVFGSNRVDNIKRINCENMIINKKP